MGQLATSIVAVLDRYVPERRAELARDAGPRALDTAGEILQVALDHLRRRPDGRFVAGKYELHPEIYRLPLEKELDEAIRADPGLAARLQDLLARYERIVRDHAAAGRYQAGVAGSGAAAQGPGSRAAGERGVAAGLIEGPVVTGDGSVAASGGVQTGGIRAGRIEAESVVDGVQMQGGDAQAAAGLVALAQAIRRGGISAEEIKARNLVSGLQFIADPGQATADDLRQEVAALREQLAQAIAAGEVADQADAEDAQEALATAEKELAAARPKGNRVVRKLAEAADVLTHGAAAAEALGKVGAQIIKLAPIAATLYQIAQTLFGG